MNKRGSKPHRTRTTECGVAQYLLVTSIFRTFVRRLQLLSLSYGLPLVVRLLFAPAVHDMISCDTHKAVGFGGGAVRVLRTLPVCVALSLLVFVCLVREGARRMSALKKKARSCALNQKRKQSDIKDYLTVEEHGKRKHCHILWPPRDVECQPVAKLQKMTSQETNV